ncbi:hypothetical protein FKP32DRAFT_77646 [Trametes sanguinea]|nr:hypothetical protein FKP32DRAFT_77646 [Trametes sanguinea]
MSSTCTLASRLHQGCSSLPRDEQLWLEMFKVPNRCSSKRSRRGKGGPVVLEIFPALSLMATGRGLRRTPLPFGVLVPTGSGPPRLAAQHLLRLFVAYITSKSELCCLLYLGPASAKLYSLHDDDGWYVCMCLSNALPSSWMQPGRYGVPRKDGSLSPDT